MKDVNNNINLYRCYDDDSMKILKKVQLITNVDKLNQTVGIVQNLSEMNNIALHVLLRGKMHINIIVNKYSKFIIINVKKHKLIESKIYKIKLNKCTKTILNLIISSDQISALYISFFLLRDIKEIKDTMLEILNINLLNQIKYLLYDIFK